MHLVLVRLRGAREGEKADIKTACGTEGDAREGREACGDEAEGLCGGVWRRRLLPRQR